MSKKVAIGLLMSLLFLAVLFAVPAVAEKPETIRTIMAMEPTLLEP
ncbi:hypothetical protein [Pyrococcus yayanosii]|uniref:Uncharacterized protein n=1 Tax=Pyrococcus yayanosii (strain CH1 / JCM 16557) TaxID=529709 RepID=F8AG73_PYRYC|nr:hypothetical protein [Pyrococcus yayanosii]AEH23909.1 hypothetical protein PYCH_02070 [Pyrococcus yayanosii CH1]